MRAFALVVGGVLSGCLSGFLGGCFDASVGDAAVIACSGDGDCVDGRVCQPDLGLCVDAVDASAAPPTVAAVVVVPQLVARGDVTVSATVAGAVSAVVEVDGVVVATAAIDAAAASAVIASDALGEGPHAVAVVAVDRFGRSGRGLPTTLLVDRTPPRLVAGSTPTLARRGDAVVARAALDGPVREGAVIRFGDVSVDADGEADGVVVASRVADVEGEIDVVVTGAIDAAGNAAADLLVGRVIVDGTPPVVSVVADVAAASRVAGFNLITVTVDVDEAITDLPEATLAGRPLSCAASDGLTRCSREVDELDVSGVAGVVVTARDAAGNVGFASTAVRLDFSPPTASLQQVSYRPAPGALRNEVVAVGRGGGAEVSFLFDEPVATASATLDTVPLTVERQGVPRVAIDDNAAVAVGSGVFAVVVTASDEVGNVGVAAIADVAIDVDIPAPAAVDTPGALVLLRAPWGETTDPRARLGVAVSARAAGGEEFVFVDSDDNVLGRAVGAGEVDLSVGDRDEVYARVVDEAGNASAAELIREGRYRITPGGKRAGSVVPNPHRLLVRRDDRGRREQEDDVEVGAEVFVAGLGVSADATWRPAGLGEGATACGDASAAFDPVVGRIVADGCAWDALRRRWEPLRGPSLGLTNAAILYSPRAGAVFLVGGQQQIGDNPNPAVFRREGDSWLALGAQPTECFAGAGAWDAVRDEMVIVCEGDLTLQGPLTALRPRFGRAPAAERGSAPIAVVASADGVVSVDRNHTWDWDGTAWSSSPPPPGIGRLVTHPTTGAPVWVTAAGLQLRGDDGVWRAIAGTTPPARFRLGSIAATDVAAGVIDVSDGGAGMWQWSPVPSAWRFLRGVSAPLVPNEIGSFGGGAASLAGATSVFVDDGWRSLGFDLAAVGNITLMDLGGRLVGVDSATSESFLLETNGWRRLDVFLSGQTPPPRFGAAFDGFFFWGGSGRTDSWAPALTAGEGAPALTIFWETFGNTAFVPNGSVVGTAGAFAADGDVAIVVNLAEVASTNGRPPPRIGPGFARAGAELILFGGTGLTDTWAFRLAGNTGAWRELETVARPPINLSVIPLFMASNESGPLLFNADTSGAVWQLDRSVNAAVVFVVDVNALNGFVIDAISVDAGAGGGARVAIFDTCSPAGFVDAGAAGAGINVDTNCARDEDGLIHLRVSAPTSTSTSTPTPSALSLASISIDLSYRRP